ncbi:MAG: right-handed parallel beta-helix repeat-containing protein [Alphaproteobacteria bacterium]|nr:right-handed parallel beta-helix repeat-containing protein [Alphaproteobacteria bacterium]
MKHLLCSSVLALAIAAGLHVAPARALVVDVVCPGGGSELQNAIDNAGPGDTLQITGVCAEDVFIGVDELTIRGKNNPTEGVEGNVSIRAARRIELRDMTVRDCILPGPGRCTGIIIDSGAQVLILNVTVSGHEGTGVSVTNGSVVEISGSLIDGNQRVGINLNTGASARVTGGSAVTGNGRNGISVGGNATAVLSGITVADNARRSLSASDNGFVIAEQSTFASDVPDGANDGGVLVNRAGALVLDGGNTVTNTAAAGGRALTVFAGSFLRQGGGDAHDTITSSNGLALIVQDKSLADLRTFTLTGDIRVDRDSLLRLRKDAPDADVANGTVTGSILVRRDSAINFVQAEGPVTVSGTVTCADAESSVDLGGQSAAAIVGGDGSELACSGYGPGNGQP